MTKTHKKPAESVEWYTPWYILQAVKKTFGGCIDLDPASCAEANEYVQASRFFTEADNGLERKWEGNIFLNPPYGRGKEHWVEAILRAAKEMKNSQHQMIVLFPDSTDTKWFNSMWAADGVCFTNKRLKFGRPGVRAVAGNTCGSALFYFGKYLPTFADNFKGIGTTVMPIRVG